MSNPIEKWFGEEFSNLDPLIQELHLKGGKLSGAVDISYGSGTAGLIGKRLAKKLGIPTNCNESPLQVSINHNDTGLLWDRTFGHSHEMKSVFTPHGSFPDGYWVESSGNISLFLGVQIIDGGWHWVQKRMEFKGVPLPLSIFPKTTAYKTIVDGRYVFSVSFTLPVLGKLLSYSGRLVPS